MSISVFVLNGSILCSWNLGENVSVRSDNAVASLQVVGVSPLLTCIFDYNLHKNCICYSFWGIFHVFFGVKFGNIRNSS